MDATGSDPASSEDSSAAGEEKETDAVKSSDSNLVSSEDCPASIEMETNEGDELKSKKNKKRKLHVAEDVPNAESNNPVVDAENSQETDATEEASTSVKRRKHFLDDEEAAVKDEDIDKFCDEIDEEDNKLYETWIQLIEAKLHPNKNNKKINE